MRIVGEWRRSDDGIVRPTVRARVHGSDGRLYNHPFLVESGADRTVFSAFLMRALRLPADRPSGAAGLIGVGGAMSFLLMNTALDFITDDSRVVTVRGQFAAFTDPQAMDLSILGRDVLDNFDVILSRRRDQVMLLAPPHQFQVSPP